MGNARSTEDELERAGDRSPSPVRAILFLWTTAVVAGFCVLFRYASAQGPIVGAPASWPDESALAHAPDRATIVMFVHPHCACSRASLTELGRTLRRIDGRASAIVVLVRPPDVPSGWERTDLRALALALPDVTLVDDDGAIEATRFGALTSGTTLLYDAGGRLEFAGGITAIRGHEGNSFGQERIVGLLTSGEADRAESPVFGCALDEAHERTSP
jgi:hypothetical protein